MIRQMVISALLLLAGFMSFGQDFPMLHFGVEDGLPSNTIYNVYKDSKGFLWIATDKGIARYNGIRFETFSTFNGLPDNEIFFFKEDRDHRIWLATYNGQLCYYKDDSFHTKKNTKWLDIKSQSSYIRRIEVLDDGTVAIYYWDGLKIVNIRNNKCSTINLNGFLSPQELEELFLLYEMPGDRYKLCIRDKYFIIDSAQHILETGPMHYDQDSARWQSGSLYQDVNYIFTSYSIYEVPSLKIAKALEAPIYRQFRSRSAAIDGDQSFVGTINGLIINDSIHVLQGNKINTINKDRLQNYWIGTAGNGIYVLSKDYMKTKIFRHAYKGAVSFAYQDRDHLFFSTDEHILYQLKNGSMVPIADYSGMLNKSWANAYLSGHCLDSCYCFYNCFNQKLIKIGNLESDPKVEAFPCSIFSRYTINEMVPVGRRLYLNLKSRVAAMDTRKITTGDVELVSDSSINERIFSMAKGLDNSLWYAYANKMCKIVNEREVVQPQFGGISFKWFGFFSGFMIGYTHDNLMYITSNYDREDIRFDLVKPRNCIWDKIYLIDSVHLLVKTSNLYRIITLNRSSPGNSEVWAIENPFLPLQAESITTDGKYCYFFKNESVTAIEAKNLYQKSEPPRLYFTSLKTADGKRLMIRNEMELAYRESRNITISFSTLSYGENVDYEYSIVKNEQDNWQSIKSEEINLVSPGYGTYDIKVRARSTSSKWSDPVICTLHISRPYWAAWWFIILCVFFGMVIIGFAIRLRILYLVQKNKRDHETEIKFMRSEYKAINALMNPHFIFNTLNNVQSLFNANDKLAANEYLRIFADLIRQNMYNVSKELIPLQKEVALVMNYLMLEKLRFEDKLNYEINIAEDIDLTDLWVPPLILQPLVENSIKHGLLPASEAGGTIQVNIHQEQGRLYIVVRDNGVGLGHTKGGNGDAYESFGMSGIKKRIEQLSVIQNTEITFSLKELHDSQGRHLWTVATITMPY